MGEKGTLISKFKVTLILLIGVALGGYACYRCESNLNDRCYTTAVNNGLQAMVNAAARVIYEHGRLDILFVPFTPDHHEELNAQNPRLVYRRGIIPKKQIYVRVSLTPVRVSSTPIVEHSLKDNFVCYFSSANSVLLRC